MGPAHIDPNVRRVADELEKAVAEDKAEDDMEMLDVVSWYDRHPQCRAFEWDL